MRTTPPSGCLDIIRSKGMAFAFDCLSSNLTSSTLQLLLLPVLLPPPLLSFFGENETQLKPSSINRRLVMPPLESARPSALRCDC